MQILKVIAPVSLQNKFCKYTSQTHWSLPVIATQLGAEKNKIDKTEILAEKFSI